MGAALLSKRLIGLEPVQNVPVLYDDWWAQNLKYARMVNQAGLVRKLSSTAKS